MTIQFFFTKEVAIIHKHAALISVVQTGLPRMFTFLLSHPIFICTDRYANFKVY